MKRILSFFVILAIAVLCSACINNYAIQQLNKKAKEYSDNGDLDSAAARLESSIDLDGSVFETRYNLAVTYMGLKQCDKALEQINAAEAISSKDAAVYYMQGVANTCLAQNLYDSKNPDCPILKLEKTNMVEATLKAQEYVKYLTDANTAYNKYLKLTPVTDVKNDFNSIIEGNNSSIEFIKNKYGI